MGNFGPDTDTVRAFYAIGAMVLIVTGAIIGYVMLEPVLDKDGRNWRKVYNNGYVFNITLESLNCFWQRECPAESCPNEHVAKVTGCCIGCKNPQSCGLRVGVQWHNVPPRKKAQRLWLFTSSDCKSYWQTGWAPYITHWGIKEKMNDSVTIPGSYTGDPYAPLEDNVLRARGFEYDELLSEASAPSAPDINYLNYHNFDDRALEDLFSKRAIDEEMFAYVNDTLPGRSSGYAAITDGCYGDPFRQMAFVVCLSEEKDEKFLGKHFSSIPWDKCFSVYGICADVNQVFVRGEHHRLHLNVFSSSTQCPPPPKKNNSLHVANL